jgi:hypothetical protein
MNPTALIRCLLIDAARDHADGVRCSANVTRPAASFFISLRSAHRRRDLSALWLFDHVPTASPVPETLGISRSEIKEEAKPGDIRGGRCPAAPARAQTSHAHLKGRGSREARWNS